MLPSKEDPHTIAFLKMAAIELRRLAEGAPEMAADLLHIVRQLETEAAEIERRTPPVMVLEATSPARVLLPRAAAEKC